MLSTVRSGILAVAGFVMMVACSGGGGSSGGDGAVAQAKVESCMLCHNASTSNDYAGPGMENPHPFAGAANIKCSTCHGGNPKGADKESSHVPPPPEIGDDEQLQNNAESYFNRLTLTGLDKYDDYEVDGKTYTALDYLQWVNPGDLRVVGDGRACGQCHQPHVTDVTASLLATSAGVLSGALYAIGADNAVPENQGLHEDTAADLAFRAINDGTYNPNNADLGQIGELIEHPVFSVRDADGPLQIFDNDLYDAALLGQDVNADNSVVTGSPLANLYHEQVAFTCGDCHLGSAGANNRYGDFRSSGCTACHMPYSQSGRYGGNDPNVDKLEPANVDNIQAPERSHVRSHRILSTAQTIKGEFQPGIDDYSCAGCHQGSNRTVMQYWGIRLDQNEDLRRGVQYPAQPDSFVTTKNDERLFDPVINNKTFNGRDDDQYILFEDYDGDGRDDTPADVHYDAGMGCIDCHGSFDLHGGDVTKAGADVFSRMEHATAAACTSCHGTASEYAQFVNGKTLDGENGQVALDSAGNKMGHVTLNESGEVWLKSKLTGALHYVPQTRDTVVDSGALHPETDEPLYSVKASFAMGRADGDDSTGLGPLQSAGHSGFSHADNMDCASCHSSWTNTCMGCHLVGEYDNGQNFSNITGERIVFNEQNADFVYQSPIPFQLGVGPNGKITQMSANTKMFFSWQDKEGDLSDVFAFTDRNGGGNNPNNPRPSLSHNAMMAHSIRGKVSDDNEGPRYCVACHLTDDGLDDFGSANYDAFAQAIASGDFASLDYDMLQEHIGSNPGNQLNSPVWVHAAAGLGSGLFLFDEHGCPINPLDEDDDRAGCGGVAPADIAFDPDNAAYDLDRIVNEDGTSNGSNNHPLFNPAEGGALRDGASDPNLSGPLGATLLQKLADRQNGVVLDAWLDADGELRGAADSVLEP